MNKKDWNEGLNNIDPALVEEHIEEMEKIAAKSRKDRTAWIRYVSVAATVCLVFGVLVASLILNRADEPEAVPEKTEETTEETTQEQSYDTETSEVTTEEDYDTESSEITTEEGNRDTESPSESETVGGVITDATSEDVSETDSEEDTTEEQSYDTESSEVTTKEDYDTESSEITTEEGNRDTESPSESETVGGVITDVTSEDVSETDSEEDTTEEQNYNTESSEVTTEEENYDTEAPSESETVGGVVTEVTGEDVTEPEREETTAVEMTTEEATVEETTENETSAIRENVVYVSELPSNYADISFVEIVPEGFKLINSLSTHNVQENVSDILYDFLGKTYDVSFFAKREIQNPFSLTSGYEKNDYQLIFRSDEASFIFKNGTSELLEAHIFGANDNSSSGKIISKDDAKNIAQKFISNYTLKKISSNYYESYSKESDGTHRISYDLMIGGYKVDGEMFVISLRADGEFVLYADRTTGLYDKFIGKVTEADIAKAEKNLYPYRLPGAYGYYEPYLKVGNDGNLYLCSSYLVDETIDGEEITREYMFYSRVYYEE